MQDNRIEELCRAAADGTLDYTDHYDERVNERPTPDKPEVRFMLCDDDPLVIETRGRLFLVWGRTAEGRIGHLLCSVLPVCRVMTAYFPGETQPEKWADADYRIRLTTARQ